MTTATAGAPARTHEINGDANSLEEAKATLQAIVATFEDTVTGHDQSMANLSRLNVEKGVPTEDPITLLGIKKERRLLLIEQVKQRVGRVDNMIAQQKAHIETHPELLNSLRETGSWLAR